jgi:hypothetical protein
MKIGDWGFSPRLNRNFRDDLRLFDHLTVGVSRLLAVNHQWMYHRGDLQLLLAQS